MEDKSFERKKVLGAKKCFILPTLSSSMNFILPTLSSFINFILIIVPENVGRMTLMEDEGVWRIKTLVGCLHNVLYSTSRWVRNSLLFNLCVNFFAASCSSNI